MRRLLQRILPVALALGLPIEIWAQAQSTAAYIPSVIPPGPNAAMLQKFSDVPVSPYTGTADVNVPIYTIQAKGISVPISLDYHTGGIRLKEQSGWVGLGWALNCGGSISRTIMDQDDFGTMGYTYFTTQVPQPVGDMALPEPDQPVVDSLLVQINGGEPTIPQFYDFYCSYEVNTTSGIYNYYDAFANGNRTYDMEPDIFNYNFPGHSGKFILTRTGQVVLQKQENIQIQFQGMGDSVTFTITDDQGNKYYFNTTETTETATTGAATPISTWLISKIVTQQQDSILFNYTPGGGSWEEADINEAVNAFCGANQLNTTVQGSPTEYNDQTLQSIVFSNGQLNFYFDNNRSDLQGGNKLDSVLIYSRNASGTLTYLKQHNFYYSYFNATYASEADSFEYCRLKLDSIKEKSASGTLPPYSFIYNNPNPGSLSAKDTFSVDHWGYFNGVGNSTFIPTMNTLYNPSSGLDVALPTYYSYSGANRSPNSIYMQTFSLQQITYPTGGSTVFNYQPNDYDFNNSNGGGGFQDVTLANVDTSVNAANHGTTTGTINLSTLYPLQPLSTDPANLTINIAFRYQINNDSIYKNSTGLIYFTFTYNGNTVRADINSATGSPGSPVFSVSIPITFTTNPGVCSWSAYIDPSVDTVATFSEVHAVFEYQETQQAYDLLENNSFIAPASGLRIQSVVNYKDASTIASEKVYTYTYSQDKLGTGSPQTYTYGRLMEFPNYARYSSTPNGAGGYCFSMSLFSSSNTGLTSVTTGNIVGYDQVTETTVDPLSGKDIGQTVYTYFNASDTPVAACSGLGLPGGLNLGNNLNGQLLSKTEYADYGGVYTPVAQTNYYYHTTNRSVYYSPKYDFILNSHVSSAMDGALCTADTTIPFETNANFYPSIKSERVLLDSTVSTVYAQQNPGLTAITRSANYYDNPLHYQVTRSYTIDSKGDTLVRKFTYPQDYIPSGAPVTYNTILDSMIGRNMVDETIEKQDSFYYPGSSAGYITGSQLSLFRISSGSSYNTIVPDRTYQLAVNSPVTNFQPFAISGNTTSLDSRYRQMISFDQYDSYNNLQQYTPIDQNSVTFVWDYSHIYPVAQVRNAALADVAATSFEADGTGNWTYTGTSTADTTTITGSLCYNLGQSGGNITKSGLTSGTTYVLSYWIKGTTALSVTGTISGYPIQGKTINGWTYFEHKFTGQTSITVSGSGYIDELRLYPSTAQMTSYTYSPLAGTTTTCDVDNKVTYYFYDAYQRLIRIKDQDGNIIKTNQYHYANQNPYNQ
jgi:hypothetical protein